MYMSSRSRKKKRLRSLTHKVEHLRLEVEDRDEVIKEYESEFMKELSSLVDESAQPEPQGAEEQQSIVINVGVDDKQETLVEGKKSDNLPDEIKKIWKAIALLTHPDRTKNDPKMTELYLSASKAAEDGSVDEILRIAAELNIEIPEESPVVEARLESLAGELEKKLKNIEESILWQWGNSSAEVRQRIMDAYIKMQRLKKKPPLV